MSNHLFLNLVFFSKQEKELLMQHMLIYHMIWSVNIWLSAWTVIQWFYFRFNQSQLYYDILLGDVSISVVK